MGNLFQGYRGITQGDPIYPQIFNFIVEVVFHHWVFLVVDNKVGPAGFWYAVSEKDAFFYAGCGIVAYTNPVWLHWEFDGIISLF